MTNLAKVKDGSVTRYPYSQSELGQDYPDVSFPAHMTDEALAAFDCVRVIGTGAPPCNPITENVVEVAPTFSSDRRRWEQSFAIVGASEAEIAERIALAKEANAQQAKQDLLASDWCEYASVRNTAVSPHLANVTEWDSYRLALRVIAVTSPAVVQEWPTKPAAVWL